MSWNTNNKLEKNEAQTRCSVFLLFSAVLNFCLLLMFAVNKDSLYEKYKPTKLRKKKRRNLQDVCIISARHNHSQYHDINLMGMSNRSQYLRSLIEDVSVCPLRPSTPFFMCFFSDVLHWLRCLFSCCSFWLNTCSSSYRDGWQNIPPLNSAYKSAT